MEKGFGFAPSTVVEVSLPLRSDRAQQFSDSVCASEPSAVTWCSRTNLIACAASPSIPNYSRERPGQPFSIAVHLVDPGCPTEHTVLHAPTGRPSVYIQSLSWSPISCRRALLSVDSSGSAAVWVQPTHVAANVARSVNSWQLDYTWQQDPLIVAKWLAGPLPYRLPGASVQQGSLSSYEERFLTREPLSPTRWPRGSFLCLCSVSAAGAVQLRWRQLAPLVGAAGHACSATWHVSQPLQLSCGVGGIAAADVIVTGAGSVVIAAVSHCQPSTVVLWEVTPPPDPTPPRPATSAPTPRHINAGTSPLVAHLLAWEARPSDAPTGPFLACSVLSSFGMAAAEVGGGGVSGPEGGSEAGPAQGAARVAAVAFDPSALGAALITVTTYGTEDPTTWTIQRWESSRCQVSIHPTFSDPSTPPTAAVPLPPPLPLVTNWTPLASTSIRPPPLTPPTVNGGTTPKWVPPPQKNPQALGFPAKRRRVNVSPAQRPLQGLWEQGSSRGSVRAGFSPAGQELVVALTERQVAGEVAVLNGQSLTQIARLEGGPGGGGGVTGLLPCGLSPTGCCVAVLTEGEREGHSLLRVMWLPLQRGAAVAGDAGSPERGESASARLWERHLADRIEWSWLMAGSHWDAIVTSQCAAEDGPGTVPGVASVLDADFYALPSTAHRLHYSTALDRVKVGLLEGVDGERARPLLLDIQARLLLDFLYMSSRALMVNPHSMPKQPWANVKELSQADVMTVHPPLVSTAHNYADTILDLALYFLTRLRRLAPYARSSSSSGGVQVADRLKLDRSFLQRLTQLAFFALALRRRNPPLPPPLPPHTGPATGIHRSFSAQASALRDDPSGTRPFRLGNGNGGQGYTADESRTVYMALQDLVKKTEKCLPVMPTLQSQSGCSEVRLHYPEGQINIPADFFDPIFQHHAKMPRPRGADAAGVLTRELELHPPSEDWSSYWDDCARSPSPTDAEVEEEGRGGGWLGGGSGLWPGRRRGAERDTALGLRTAAGAGDFLGFMGSRRDVIMSSWRTMPEHTWHKCTNCGRQTAALALTSTASQGDSGDVMALWQTSWAARWNEECPICGGRWMRVA